MDWFLLTFLHKRTLLAAMSIIGEDETERIINKVIDEELEKQCLYPDEVEVNVIWDPDDDFVDIKYRRLNND